MLATTSSAAMHTLTAQPNLISTLQCNALLFRQILNKLEALPLETPEFDPFYSSSPSQSTNSAGNKEALISIPSHPKSALIHIFLLEPPSTLEEEEALLQDIVDETLQSSAVLITRARRLRGQEIFEPEPSLKVYISSVLNKKEVEKAAQGLKQAIQKVAGSE
jgi:serine palmitoyltransferase